ncbi:MAG: hypothetical protein V4480_04545 [Patescibacteria group bacterium]
MKASLAMFAFVFVFGAAAHGHGLVRTSPQYPHVAVPCPELGVGLKCIAL